jgi:hypothetical protein
MLSKKMTRTARTAMQLDSNATASLARVEAGSLIRSWVMTKRPMDWTAALVRTAVGSPSSTLRMVQASQPPRLCFCHSQAQVSVSSWRLLVHCAHFIVQNDIGQGFLVMSIYL